ncbi:MAG: hypothetical protein ACJAVX_002380 [Pseudoalteromonas rhizosphaerae]|jgi:hypothetical protein|uniref:Uncharacterized protein n=1 Tax=Pseudoalteromonas neustonica TaxID=1840331 RepID=A0ABY3F7X0_9GAMM|nr:MULTISPECIES: hypothetical protein [Pseudoalteromonas]MBB1342210.1 hypothetical protein [Pseudoalteromonas sp. SR45-6]MBB1418626.1 hypothetical protein [Pseudoalteromonas sp. SG44-1]MBB1506851.1 hypothetical protein [Pseudoalteromonas sp. SG41-1]TVU80090.1 hypothetical protein FQP85_21215 [Pseudoalteromonas neustonica]|tara:strand:+ start:704 stop:1027 length:324 start_codon:yes stop_codon:yes gene_type:complete
MKSYNSIEQRIDILQSRIEAYQDEIETLETEPKNNNERIIFKFIETGSTGKTKDFVRELGIKSPRDSLYSSGDVSKLIKDGASDISPALLEIARALASARNKNGPAC